MIKYQISLSGVPKHFLQNAVAKSIVNLAVVGLRCVIVVFPDHTHLLFKDGGNSVYSTKVKHNIKSKWV